MRCTPTTRTAPRLNPSPSFFHPLSPSSVLWAVQFRAVGSALVSSHSPAPHASPSCVHVGPSGAPPQLTLWYTWTSSPPPSHAPGRPFEAVRSGCHRPLLLSSFSAYLHFTPSLARGRQRRNQRARIQQGMRRYGYVIPRGGEVVHLERKRAWSPKSLAPARHREEERPLWEGCRNW